MYTKRMAGKSQFNLKGVVAIAVGILLLIILFPFLKLIKKFVSKGTTAVDDIVQQAEMNVLKKKYGNHRDFDLIANDVVPSIYHAFHDDWDEDEERAIKELNRLKTVTQTQIASDVYKQLYNRSLKLDSEKYLTDTSMFNVDLGRVSSIVRSNWF